MVHYDGDDAQSVSATIPPTCPRCGSHRTEIVGQSNDGKTLTLRCSSCGERSLVAPQEAAASCDDLLAELEAMKVIGEMLAHLPTRSRARVLRWTTERFEIAAVPGDPNVAHAVSAEDETLAVDDLYTFFAAKEAADMDDACDVQHVLAAEEEIAPQPPVAALRPESSVRSFVADFKRLAEEWQSALLDAASADVTA